VNRITQPLAERVKELEERYADTLPGIENAIDALTSSVGNHFRKMGLVLE
jgi:type I restriction enzyme M protein